jgi:VWFA-related protein
MRSPARLTVLPIALVLLAVAVAVHATYSEVPRFREVIEAPLVELEILVTDGAGRAVTGLAAQEFQIFENDVEVPLSHFAIVGEAPPAGAAAALAADEAGIHLAVFVDDVHVGVASRRRLLLELGAVLESRLRPQDRVMIAVYDGRTRVALPFSRDRKALREALEQAEGISTARLLAEQERADVLESLALDAAGGHGWSPCLHIQEFVDRYSDQEFDRVRRAVTGLRSFVDSLSGIAGRKAVLHVSDGIPLRAGAEAADLALDLCSGRAQSQGVEQGDDVGAFGPEVFGPAHHTLDALRFDTSSLWEDVAARANAGNVSLYTLQAGHPTEARLGNAQTPSHIVTTTGVVERHAGNLQETLFRLADQTGGRAFLNGGDPTGSVSEAIQELRSYYSAGYAPARPDDLSLRRIRVELRGRPDLVVRHRKVYRLLSRHERIGEQLLGRLLHGGGGGDAGGLSLELASRAPTSNGDVRARFRLQVPLASLGMALLGDGEAAGFTAFVVAADDSGGTSAVRRTLVPVRLPKLADGAAARPNFVWEVEMVLRPGKQRLGIAVHDESSGDTNFLVRNFDVPRL